jgi:hypothetical protein
MLDNAAVEYPEPDEDKASKEIFTTNLKVIHVPCLVHLLLKRPCFFVLCQAKLFI